jgi:ornithine cyclodeaminase/alanine dehydrogenase-like protein (mu-crystallin family)
LINNDVTDRVLRIETAIEALEESLTQFARDEAVFQPRTDIVSPVTERSDDYDWDGEPEWYTWGSLLGAISDPPRLAFRFKSDVLSWERDDGTLTESKYNEEPGTFMGFVMLFDSSTGELLALLNDGELQHVRVGANAGIACNYLAREDASTVGMLGSGGMARTYLEAFDVFRDLESVRVYSPTREHREEYAREMSEKLGVAVETVDDPEAAVRDVDIAATCTDTRSPIFEADWLSAGSVLINSVPTEPSEGTYEAADRVVTIDNRPFHRHVIGGEDDDRRYKERQYRWFEQRDYDLLGDVLLGERPGRADDDEVILYDNISSGIQFAAVANVVYEAAKDRGLGMEIPQSWFQQDVRN